MGLDGVYRVSRQSPDAPPVAVRGQWLSGKESGLAYNDFSTAETVAGPRRRTGPGNCTPPLERPTPPVSAPWSRAAGTDQRIDRGAKPLSTWAISLAQVERLSLSETEKGTSAS
jgi:hypothetical protein